MRSTNSPQVFVERLRKTARNLEQVPRVATNAAALAVKTSIVEQTASVAPGLRLRGVRGSGKIGVKYIPGSSGGGHATALVVATGPFQLIERDTSPHDILPRGLSAKTTRGRTSGKRALAGPNFGPVAGVHVSGSKGKHPFEKGADKAKPLVEGVLRRATVAAIAKELG